jgi:3-oxoacyl-[acyl-carrier protein] reductase
MNFNTNPSSQVAIVTGASRGIGAAIARRLARDGFAVAVNYAGRSEDADLVVNAIASDGGRAIAVKADVSEPAAVRVLFDEAVAAFGRVDVLVNNAGIMPSALPQLADTDDATFDRLFAVNVKGTFNTLREAARRLEAGGRIVNFSSSVIGLALPGYAVYAATKSAVETFTNIMAKELRGKRITVNAVAPGPTATALFLDGKTPETIERMAKAAPLERLGTPEDIANAVALLASPDGAWINGQTLRANGGLV